jgi:hypothetical protein
MLDASTLDLYGFDEGAILSYNRTEDSLVGMIILGARGERIYWFKIREV